MRSPTFDPVRYRPDVSDVSLESRCSSSSEVDWVADRLFDTKLLLPLSPRSGSASLAAMKSRSECVGRAVTDEAGDFREALFATAQMVTRECHPPVREVLHRGCPRASPNARAKAARDMPLSLASSGTDHGCAASPCIASSAAFSRGSADALYQRGVVVQGTTTASVRSSASRTARLRTGETTWTPMRLGRR